MNSRAAVATTPSPATAIPGSASRPRPRASPSSCKKWRRSTSSTTQVTVVLREGATHGSATGAAIGSDDIVSGVNAVRGSNHGDVIIGNSSANTLDGQEGNDRIDGMGGADTLTGGSGSDVFVYNSGAVTITDFVSNLVSDSDRIDLSG